MTDDTQMTELSQQKVTSWSQVCRNPLAQNPKFLGIPDFPVHSCKLSPAQGGRSGVQHKQLSSQLSKKCRNSIPLSVSQEPLDCHHLLHLLEIPGDSRIVSTFS